MTQPVEPTVDGEADVVLVQLSYVAGRLAAAGESLTAAAPELAHLRVELGAWCAQETAARRSAAVATPQASTAQVTCANDWSN